MNVTTLRIIEFLMPISIGIYGVVALDLETIGFVYPWNIYTPVIVGCVLAIIYNALVAAKCPNSKCGKHTLFKESIFPSLLSNGYKCKSCKKAYNYHWGKLSE